MPIAVQKISFIIDMDAHKNFAVSVVATAPSPATSGTSLVVAAGTGALFPTPPFNATVFPADAQPSSVNAEIVRVTAIVTDTLTLLRSQEGTGQRAIVVGDRIAATITVKSLSDIESLITTSLPLTGSVDPNGAVTGAVGQLYIQVSGGVATIWINTTGLQVWV